MNRRSFLTASLGSAAALGMASTALGKSTDAAKAYDWRTNQRLRKALNPGPVAVETGLEEYNPGENLDKADAAHLLRRVGYNVNPTDAAFVQNMSAAAVVDYLLNSDAFDAPEAPEFEEFQLLTRQELAELTEEERIQYQNDVVRSQINNNRLLQAWWVHKFGFSGMTKTEGQTTPLYNPLRERMTLLLHDLYANEIMAVRFAELMYKQNETFRGHAFGDLRDLARRMVDDPAMLIYLNGNQNSKNRPNENFAREILELFTLGEGNYTEQDIIEAARTFTGWIVNQQTGQSSMIVNLHDFESKTMFGETYRYPATMEGALAEIDFVIGLIFAQRFADDAPEYAGRSIAAVHLAERLYKTFVYEHVDTNIVGQLTEMIEANDFDIAPALRALLSSAHFYDQEFRGAMIKSPTDFMIGIMHQFPMTGPTASPSEGVPGGRQTTNIWYLLSQNSNDPLTNGFLDALGEQVFNPPNVAGWPGYHEWINTATYPLRNYYSDLFADGIALNNGRVNYATIQVLDFGRQFPSFQTDGDALISEIAEYLLPFDLSDKQHGDMVEALVGNRDRAYEWPEKVLDEELAAEGMLNLIKAMMRLPEFQLA